MQSAGQHLEQQLLPGIQIAARMDGRRRQQQPRFTCGHARCRQKEAIFQIVFQSELGAALRLQPEREKSMNEESSASGAFKQCQGRRFQRFHDIWELASERLPSGLRLCFWCFERLPQLGESACVSWHKSTRMHNADYPSQPATDSLHGQEFWPGVTVR